MIRYLLLVAEVSGVKKFGNFSSNLFTRNMVQISSKMGLIDWIIKALPKSTIEKIYYNPILGKISLKLYESQASSKDKQVFSIHNGLAKMALYPNAYGERAIIYDAFEPDITRLFLSMVKTGDIVFDVGSWIGYYAILAAAKGASKVVAIEIDPENVERIKENAELNNFTQLQIEHIGVGVSSGRKKIDTQAKSQIMRQAGEKGNIEVQIDTLDNIAAANERIDVMVMDIEGYELFAIEGMKDLLSRKAVRNMVIEVHPHMIPEGRSDKEVLDMLHSFGYSTRTIKYTDSRSIYHLVVSINPSGH